LIARVYAIPYPRACTWNKKQRSCFHRARDGDGCPAQAAAAAADLPPGHGPGITAQPAALLLSRPGCAPLSICRPDPSGFFRRARLRRQRRAGQVLHVAQITALAVTVAGWIPAAKGFKRAVLSPVAFLNTPPYNPPVVQFDGGRRHHGHKGAAKARDRHGQGAAVTRHAALMWYHARAKGRIISPRKNFFTPRRGVIGRTEIFLQKRA